MGVSGVKDKKYIFPLEQKACTNGIKKYDFAPEPFFKTSKPAIRLQDVKTKEDVTRLTGYSQEFIDILIAHEGFKTKPYKDIAGKKTVGIGHNISADSKYKFGKNELSESQIYQLLAQDLLIVKKGIKDLIGDTKLKPHQHEALSDLAFNVGIEGLKETKLIKQIKEGQLKQAAANFNFVTFNKGKVSTALCKRRIDDINLFYKNNHSIASVYAMENIAFRARVKFSQQLNNANWYKKPYINLNKNRFEREVQQIIEKARKQINK